jgi:CheY-like chemotaxis protein
MSDPSPSVVLLVEDEPLVRLVVADLLHEAGFRIVEAANAAEAIEVLEAGVMVDVLLADVDMPPGINGYALAQLVHQRWPSIEILITSGRQWPGEGDLPPGSTFLPKPCPNEAMLSHVTAAAERAQAARRTVAASAQVIPFPKTA